MCINIKLMKTFISMFMLSLVNNFVITCVLKKSSNQFGMPKNYMVLCHLVCVLVTASKFLL